MKIAGAVFFVPFVVACGNHMATSHGGPDASSDGGGDAAPIAPTVSSWLGTNVAADLPRIDITYQLTAFDTAAAQKDPDGYPIAGASGTSSTDIGYILPSGTYKIAFTGTGTLAVSGIGTLGPTWTTANGEQRNTLDITGTPGAFGHFLTLTVTNGAAQTVTGIRILYPGFDYDSPPLFNPQFLAVLKPFRALRFMDWESTNGSTISDWADHPAAAQFGASANGQPWEHIVELVNETGKDCWVTVPEHATDAYVHAMAQYLHANLDFDRIAAARASQGVTAPFELQVEDANETWNTGFTAYATYLAAAQQNTTRYTGAFTGTIGPSWQSSNTDWMMVAQYHGDRLANIGDIFKQELAEHASIVKPVLAGWAAGAAVSDESLSFIAANIGAATDKVAYIAIAPYFATADETTTGSLDAIFPALEQGIDGMNATMQDFAQLSTKYGIPIAAYEGGQSITGSTNLPIKHLAQYDARMHDTYLKYVAFWKQNFGESLFMHFSLAGDLGLPENIYQYGFWGSIASVLVDPAMCGQNLPMLTGSEDPTTESGHCPKYQALAEQAP